jgi:hypothetical protein
MHKGMRTIFVLLAAIMLLAGININANAATVTWTGAGIDNLASNPANWSGGIVPLNGDKIIFDSASSKDCTWNLTVSLASLSIKTGYTGKVSLPSASLTVLNPVFWTGAGADNLASNPANWSGGIVPQNGDEVVFDNTSSKNCTWDINAVPDFISLTGYTGTVTLNSGLTINGSLTIAAGLLDLNNKNLTINSYLLIISSGSLNATSSTITVKGNWANYNSFTPGTSTVILSGTNQTIYGNTTFYNLTKTVTSADTLYFKAGSTQIISNSLTLQGANGELLALRSTQDDSYWYIDPQGTHNTSFIDIKDLYNLSSTNIDAPDSVNSGNNSNVNFGGRPINITTNPATNVTAVSATLNAAVNPNGLSTTAYFQWGISTSYGNTTSSQSIGYGTNNVDITADLTGLSQGTIYYYRVVAGNAGGTDYGSDLSFTTTSAASNISVYPASQDFAGINVGSSSSPQIFTISNTGNSNLVIGSIYLTGTNLDQFVTQNDTCSGMTIAPSAACTIELLFIPSYIGPLTANLSIPSNDPDTPALNIGLSGTGEIQQCL